MRPSRTAAKVAVSTPSPRFAVALRPIGNSRWAAGAIQFDGLLSALREHAPADVDIRILLSRWDDDPKWNDAPYPVLSYPNPPRFGARWFVDRLAHRVAGWQVCRRTQLREHRIDAVAFGFPPSPFRVPMVGWIPDFQHVHLPELFSSDERQITARLFRRIASDAAAIVVASESVRGDFARQFPQHATKARVLRPVAAMPRAMDRDLPATTANRYGAPERFFLVPGQFWVHKNHRAVFNAVAQLQRDGVPVHVVCTGRLADHRNPSHFGELARDIAARGLEPQVTILGHIPYDDVLQLMRRSIGVVSASRFEGYGLAVDEAAMLGKPQLLSRISAHVEHDASRATYFDPDDDAALAREMKRLWENAPAGPDRDAERTGSDAAAARRLRYATGFLNVVQEVCTRRSTSGSIGRRTGT